MPFDLLPLFIVGVGYKRRRYASRAKTKTSRHYRDLWLELRERHVIVKMGGDLLTSEVMEWFCAEECPYAYTHARTHAR